MADRILKGLPTVPLNELGAAEAARQISSRRISAADLLLACIEQIEHYEPDVHAWAHVDPTTAKAEAEKIDVKVREGEAVGALAGVPVGIKDIFNTRDMPTQMGSPIWDNFTPGNDARVIHDLRMSEALIPGKTVTAEFAVHAPGPTENPHRGGYIPGTSSSGSAAAVAAYMVPVAIGTQTAGSIIRPASYCGIYGFKPSFGLIPRTAMLKTTDTLDTVGWFARNVEDLKLLFDICRVKGLDYPIAEEALNDPARQSTGHRPWRVGFIRGPKWNEAEADTRESVAAFAEKLARVDGVVVEEVEAPPELDAAHEVHATIYDRALAYYFKEEFQRHTLVSPQIYEIVERGNNISVNEYQVAMRRQTAIARRMDIFLQDYDCLLDMATGGEAFEGLGSVDRLDHALIWTLCGLPAVSVPALTGPTGLPLGVQFVGRRYNDPLLLSFLEMLDRERIAPRRTNPEPPMSSAALQEAAAAE